MVWFRTSPTERMTMKKLALPVSGLAMAAGTLVSAQPAMAIPDPDAGQISNSPAEERDRIDSLLEDGAEADPLDLIPGATTDPAKIKEIEESAVPATVVVNPDSGEIVAAKVESSAIGHVIVDLAQPDSIFPTLTK
ncbi:hypothetical protein ABH903_001534 [Brevibacterium epidermidis]|jgi:hypothetical protein|uniref:Uncharacterized protein n=2 Tax=Brevibacterium epidermidis TaxID=1698 RepID=A0ABV4EJ05_BREEP